jgi:hypothetical protein
MKDMKLSNRIGLAVVLAAVALALISATANAAGPEMLTCHGVARAGREMAERAAWALLVTIGAILFMA